ncbi:MAG TPA: helix-turn-helix domain-containing protein [Candidatus Binatia bacterium]|nr:helix-turn-helix domain-containing protein [Candidatus Binatia bacterium]
MRAIRPLATRDANAARSGARRLSRREQLGVESRRRIIDAAAALMAERGFAGTSIAAVSQRSGLPSGSIYWHFDSKETLLAAVVEEGARRWFGALPRIDRLLKDPARRTAALFEAIDASLESHPEFLRLLLLIALERRDVDPTSLAVIRRVRARALASIRKMLLVLLEPLGPRDADHIADEFARLVLVVADGSFVAQHIDPEQADVRRSFGLLRRALTALVREMDVAPRRNRR